MTRRDGPLPDKGPSPHPTMPKISITISGIRKLLQNLDIHKAMGPDQISAEILKELQDILAPILKIIFNYSFNTGTVPCDWKMANITPLFKKGDRSQPNNYRSISLTSIVSIVNFLNIYYLLISEGTLRLTIFYTTTSMGLGNSTLVKHN